MEARHTYTVVLIASAIFFALVLILCSNDIDHREAYINSSPDTVPSDERAMTFINVTFGRNIVFPYFNSVPYLASERAVKDTSAVVSNAGSCRIVYKPPAVNDSYAIVQENRMFYSLKYTCLQLQYRNWRVDEVSGSVTVTFLIKSIVDLAHILRLNAIFIECDAGSLQSSVAYCITNPEISLSSVTTFPVDLHLTLRMVPGTNDSLFDYSKVDATYVPLEQVLATQYARTSHVLNVRVFYMEEIQDSYQSIGRRTQLMYRPDEGRSIVFDKGYAEFASTNVPMYEFCNNLAIWWRNFVAPVFTFSFELCVNISEAERLRGVSVVVNKVYMDNDLGLYVDGAHLGDNTGRQKRSSEANRVKLGQSLNSDNVCAVIIRGDSAPLPQHYDLMVTTGSYSSIGINNEDLCNVHLQLPYLTVGSSTSMTVQLTVTPSEKIVYVEWIGAASRQREFAFARRNCSGMNAGRNNLSRLFTEKPREASNTLENIVMDYDTAYVSGVNYAKMGYQNFMK